MCIFAGAGLAGIFSAIGTVVSAVGSIAAGQQQQQVANYNAKVAENTATAERQRASYEAGLIEDDKRRVLAMQRAGAASAGLEVSQGTPVAVLGDSAKAGELDILARKYSGEAAATAYGNDATRFRAEGRAASTAGIIGGFSSILGGFGKMAARGSAGFYRPLGS